MQSRQRSLDGTEHKLADSKTPRAKKVKKAGKQRNRLPPKRGLVKKRSDTQSTGAAKPSTAQIKNDKEEQKIFFGRDLHKKFLQVMAVDQKGNLLMNKSVQSVYPARYFASVRLLDSHWCAGHDGGTPGRTGPLLSSMNNVSITYHAQYCVVIRNSATASMMATYRRQFLVMPDTMLLSRLVY